MTIYRPTATDAGSGWVSSSGGALYDAIDEVTASDADYVSSPDLGSTPGPVRMSIGPIPAGTLTQRFRARGIGGAGEARIVFFDAGSTQVGASAWQALTASFADYTLTATTTGVATSVEIQVRAGVFDPASLFASGEQGVWYDPSDFSTLYQDRAGTVPVTAVEQVVGKMLDKSGRGNHFTAGSDAARPKLSARVNLLTKTEQFDDAAWTKQSGTTVSPTKVADPNGNLTAFSVAGNGSSGLYQIVSGTVAVNTIRSVYLRVPTGTATVDLKDPVQTQGIINCSLTTIWQRFTLTETTSPAAGYMCGLWVAAIPASGIEVAWPDIRVANDGVGLPPYQRVNTSTDYDTAGFPVYLQLDGVDDWGSTPTITPGTDKVQVFAGVRKLSDAARGAVLELSASADANNGALLLTAPNAATATFAFDSKGTTLAEAEATGQTAPKTAVLTALGDIAGASAKLRINGADAATNTGTQGTGNYLAAPLYIGARAGASLYSKARLYGLIVRFGANLTAQQISDAEAWMNNKTKAY